LYQGSPTSILLNVEAQGHSESLEAINYWCSVISQNKGTVKHTSVKTLQTNCFPVT
jgi:hypothetical protein